MNDIIPHKLWTVKLSFNKKLSGDLPEKLSCALEDVVASVFMRNTEHVEGDNWEITLTTIGEPNLDKIINAIETIEVNIVNKKEVIIEELPEVDWLQHVHDNFPPVIIGKFFVYGSHYDGEFPEELIPLKVDAATAFGSGEHETTQGCIQALEYLVDEKKYNFKNALDMGCGSGILAIVMANLMPEAKITAIDIDPESVVVTNRHASLNGIPEKINAATGDGYSTVLAQKNAPYDIIASNILSGPLIEMAPEVSKVLKEGGYCILSGLLLKQKENVVDAYVVEGLELIHAEEIGEWQALVMRKTAK